MPGPIHLLPKALSRSTSGEPKAIVPVSCETLLEFVVPGHLFPHRKFKWLQIVSVSGHAAIVALLLLVPFFSSFDLRPPWKDKLTITDLASPLDHGRLLVAAKELGQGGGGGGERSPIPASTGQPPRFKMKEQLAKPTVIKNPAPDLSAEMTLVGLPEKMQSDPLHVGDPLADSLTNSNGPGAASGMGTGAHGGMGPGDGPGKGLGKYGGEGGDVFRPGTIGVGWPTCFYSPQPPYTDEARQAKYSGTVLVDAVVTADGRVSPTRVLKNPGLGLDDSVIKTLKTWRCKPALGPDHRPVAVAIPFEVAFRLF